MCVLLLEYEREKKIVFFFQHKSEIYTFNKDGVDI